MLNEKQTKEVADALATLRGEHPVWNALKTFIEDVARDANDLATEPVIPPDQRSYWSGAERQTRDLLADLEELRAGTFKVNGKMVKELVEEEE